MNLGRSTAGASSAGEVSVSGAHAVGVGRLRTAAYGLQAAGLAERRIVTTGEHRRPRPSARAGPRGTQGFLSADEDAGLE